MAEFQITNDELLDYLRHDLDDGRRKEIAARLYKDTELQRRFKEVQRIEALVSENYDFGQVNISSETEKNIVRYINETVANIITEKEQNILSVKKLIEENDQANREHAKRRYLWSGIGWAAVIILCVSVIFNFIANVSKSSQRMSSASNKDIKPASPLTLPEKNNFNSLKMDYVSSETMKIDEDDRIDFNADVAKSNNIVNDDNSKNENFTKTIQKFDNSKFVKRINGEVPPAVLKVELKDKERGDLNKDGLIDKKDLEILTAMIQKDSAYKLGLPADIDKDNQVTLKDLVLLAKIVENNVKSN